jgi:hypothetical protein
MRKYHKYPTCGFDKEKKTFNRERMNCPFLISFYLFLREKRKLFWMRSLS